MNGLIDNPMLQFGMGLLGGNYGPNSRAAFANAMKGGMLGLQQAGVSQARQAQTQAAQQRAALQQQQLQMAMAAAAKKKKEEEQMQQLISQKYPQLLSYPPDIQKQIISKELMSPYEQPRMIQDAAGYQRYASGPQAGQRVFPDVVAPPKTPLVQFMGSADEKMAEFAGKGIEARIGGFRESAKAANDLQSSLNRFQMAMEQAKGTGSDEKMKLVLRQYGKMFGFPIDETKLANAQQIEMAGKTMVAEQLRMNTGPQTDFDARFTSEYMPGLENTTEANRAAINYMGSSNKIKQIAGNLANSAYSTVSKGGFEAANEIVSRADQIVSNSPSVIQVQTEQGPSWVYFKDFYNAKRRKGMKDMDILQLWMSQANAARGGQ